MDHSRADSFLKTLLDGLNMPSATAQGLVQCMDGLLTLDPERGYPLAHAGELNNARLLHLIRSAYGDDAVIEKVVLIPAHRTLTGHDNEQFIPFYCESCFLTAPRGPVAIPETSPSALLAAIQTEVIRPAAEALRKTTVPSLGQLLQQNILQATFAFCSSAAIGNRRRTAQLDGLVETLPKALPIGRPTDSDGKTFAFLVA
jgi:hypothetical protein